MVLRPAKFVADLSQQLRIADIRRAIGAGCLAAAAGGIGAVTSVAAAEPIATGDMPSVIAASFAFASPVESQTAAMDARGRPITPVQMLRNAAGTWRSLDFRPWLKAVAMAAETETIFLGGRSGAIVKSGDGGKSWKILREGVRDVKALAVSRDGTRIIAVGNEGAIHVGTADGAAWSTRTVGHSDLEDIAISDDGKVAIAVARDGKVLVGADRGARALAVGEYNRIVAHDR